jgi:hypothetical protein
LKAFTNLATRFQHQGLNLWNSKTAFGKSLKMAFDFILPYLLDKKAWTGPQINEFRKVEALPILQKAITQYGCSACTQEMKRLTGSSYPSLLMLLL